jgi:hypothetical protein
MSEDAEGASIMKNLMNQLGLHSGETVNLLTNSVSDFDVNMDFNLLLSQAGSEIDAILGSSSGIITMLGGSELDALLGEVGLDLGSLMNTVLKELDLNTLFSGADLGNPTSVDFGTVFRMVNTGNLTRDVENILRGLGLQ